MCRNPSWCYAISIEAPSTPVRLSADKCCSGSTCCDCWPSCVTSAWSCAPEQTQSGSFVLTCACPLRAGPPSECYSPLSYLSLCTGHPQLKVHFPGRQWHLKWNGISPWNGSSKQEKNVLCIIPLSSKYRNELLAFHAVRREIAQENSFLCCDQGL